VNKIINNHQARIKFIKTHAKTISILHNKETAQKLHFCFSFDEFSQNILTKPQNGIQFKVNSVQVLFFHKTFHFGGSQSQNSSILTQCLFAEK
jgi:hypothetical protein